MHACILYIIYQFCTALIHSVSSLSVQILSLPSAIFEHFLFKDLLYMTLLHTKSFLPSVFDVFVDAASNDHGHDSVIPGGDEHKSKTQAHSQERQSPVGENTHFTTPAH